MRADILALLALVAATTVVALPQPSESLAEQMEAFFNSHIETSESDLQNAIGTPCSKNIANASLDIAIAIDFSNGNTEPILDSITSTLENVVSTLTYNIAGGSCVGLLTYDGNGQNILDSLSDCDDYDTVFQNLNSMQVSEGYTPDPLNGLTWAQQMFNNRAGAKKVIILTATGPTSTSQYTYNQTVQTLRQQGIFVITINQQPTQNSISQFLTAVSAPGQVFNAFEENLDSKIFNALTYATCTCPRNLPQLTAYNPLTNHVDFYADCIDVYKSATPFFLAERLCETKGGSLLALTSQQKFDFVQQTIVPTQLPGVTSYNIGLVRNVRTKDLSWDYYNRQQVPLGNFHPWATNALPKGGDCGYMTQFSGHQFGFNLGECNVRLSYICQVRACDADYKGCQ